MKLEERVTEQVAQLDRGWTSFSVSSRRLSPTRSSPPARSRSSRRTGARSATCFVDLRGFTAFTDSAEPEEVESRAARHITHTMGALITRYGGTVDRFAGDGILIFFNDPLPIPDPGQRAARMALEMQAAFAPLRARWLKSGLRARPRYRHRARVCHARRLRLRGALGLHGDRQRRQSRRPAVRQGQGRTDTHQPAPAGGAR